MSDDLISKNALMEDFRNTITENSDTFDWLNMISRQTVAYDVGKVIEKMKRNEEDAIKSIMENGKTEFHLIKITDLKELFEAYTKEQIEIVKSGGVLNGREV